MRAQSVAKMGPKTITSGMKTFQGERFGLRHRTPGTTEVPGRRRNKSTNRTKDSLPDSNTIMDIRREGVSEYDTTARTGSQGQGTVRSFRGKMKQDLRMKLGSA